MHNLRIEGRKIFLDGFEVKDVNGYELKVNGEEQGAELILKLTVQDTEVKPKPVSIGSGGIAHSETLAIVGSSNPERVVTKAELEKLLDRYFGEKKTGVFPV
ncbi:hypothetical protein [Paenibacillus odorifer]|uniref:Uncharacterized protein n=1 Tax=Paenibacillus odorifer TaxID=189426 RepID=A0A1R0X955_9BACL|nr:hypothetical protein [Paenibacillus odorifer]OMD31373.1 hypothetical protein BJP51_19220 [Paenibacillus odorifer]